MERLPDWFLWTAFGVFAVGMIVIGVFFIYEAQQRYKRIVERERKRHP